MSVLTLALGSLTLLAAPQAVQQTVLEYGQPPFLHVRYPLTESGFQGVAHATPSLDWTMKVLSGDLDGDGDLDLAITRDDAVLLMWNSGGGWIERADRLLVPARAAAIGDLDGDGDEDLVTASLDEAEVLLSDGQGGFATPVVLSLRGEPTDVLLADLDLDGDLDAVVLGGDHVTVLHGDGLGGFPTLSLVSLTPSGAEGRGALGDVDEDGWPDLLVGPALQLLRGDGQGGFLAPVSLAGWVDRLELADFDGDGHLDLLCGEAGMLALHPGDGTGTFTAATWTGGYYPDDVKAGDFDGDGDLDILTKAQYGLQLQVWTNDGTGQFVVSGYVATSGRTSSERQLAVQDLDGDGALDVASLEYEELTLLTGDGACSFRLPPDLGVQAGNVDLADVDGDGAKDLVCATDPPTTLLGDGLGGFGAPLVSPGPGGLTQAVGDVDGDGRLDLVLAGMPHDWDYPGAPGSTDIVVALGDGTGLFPSTTSIPVGDEPVSPALADLDQDGDLDIAVATRWSGVGHGIGLLLSDGAGGFVPDQVLLSYGGLQNAALGDVTGDGICDLTTTTYWSGWVSVVPGLASGGYGAPVDWAVPSSAYQVKIADLDLDGRRDLVVLPGVDAGKLLVLWGEPGGGHSAPVEVPESGSLVHPRDLEVADVDGNGVAELLVAFEGFNHQDSPGGIAVLRRSGPRDFEWIWTFGSSDAPWSLAVADLDGNGSLDLVSGTYHVNYGLGPECRSGGPVRLLLNQLPPEASCTGEVSYCVAKLNSAGCLPRICSSGTPSLTGPDDFVVTAERVVSHRPGLMIWSLTPTSLPFQGGMLCLAPPIVRTGLLSSGGTTGVHDCSGSFAYPLTQSYMLSKGLTAGTQVFAQYWSRDTAQLPPVMPTGLTDALSFTIRP